MLTEKEIKLFWERVDKGPHEKGCWLWTGRKNRGYGQLDINKGRKMVYAHRVSYALAHGGVMPTLDVLHKCDNPPCVNPAHLYAGTHMDNMRDMHAKKRRTPARGEAHGMAKLTGAQVVEIRQKYATGEFTQTGLGDMYGISHAQVFDIVNRNVWKHIP